VSYKIDTNDLIEIGYFLVDSGQAMVGDPRYLDEWDANKNDEWNLEGKAGDYSYQGASATTVANSPSLSTFSASKSVALTLASGL